MQACVCQRECWYTTVLHLQWSLLRKEPLVHVEQDSCAAACVLQGVVPACGHWEWLRICALCHSQSAVPSR